MLFKHRGAVLSQTIQVQIFFLPLMSWGKTRFYGCRQSAQNPHSMWGLQKKSWKLMYKRKNQLKPVNFPYSKNKYICNTLYSHINYWNRTVTCLLHIFNFIFMKHIIPHLLKCIGIRNQICESSSHCYQWDWFAKIINTQ